jgi:hyperosmotically inducible periplasmic protein
MLIIKKMIVLISLLAFLGIGTLGCEQKGPAEKAGEKVDEAAEQAGEKMEEAGEKAGELMEEGGEKLEETGEKMK